jgi:hypothetical protein
VVAGGVAAVVGAAAVVVGVVAVGEVTRGVEARAADPSAGPAALTGAVGRAEVTVTADGPRAGR